MADHPFEQVDRVAQAIRATLMEQAAIDPVRWANAAGSVDATLLARAALDAATPQPVATRWCQCGHHQASHNGNYNGSKACDQCSCPCFVGSVGERDQ